MAEIPTTDKYLPIQRGRDFVFFNEFHHCNNKSYTQTYTNLNEYALNILISVVAGSGDTSPNTWDTGREYFNNNDYQVRRLTHAGRRGSNIVISTQEADKEKIARFSLAGGHGTRGDIQIGDYQGYQYKKKGDDHSHTRRDWVFYNQNIHTRTKGESASFIITLKPKEKLLFDIQYQGADQAPFRGSINLCAIV